MYSEYQEYYIYSIISAAVVAIVLTSVAVIYNYGSQNIKASFLLVGFNVLIVYGMYKYTVWLKRQKKSKKGAHNQAL